MYMYSAVHKLKIVLSDFNAPVLTRFVACAKSCLQFDVNINMIADYHSYVIDNLKNNFFLFSVTGYYFDSVLDKCNKCSYCFPEIPNLTTRIRACEVPDVDRDYQCVPISHTKYWEGTR
jgi:hypothetical protein